MSNKKMDHKLLSRQKHEIKTVATKYGLTQKKVRELQKEIGVSRKAVEDELLLREIYPVKKKTSKSKTFKKLKK